MERRSRISLDNPAFTDRARQRSVAGSTHKSMDVHPFSRPSVHTQAVATVPISPSVPKPTLLPLQKMTTHAGALKPENKSKLKVHLPRQARSSVLRRQMVKAVSKKYLPKHHRPLMPMILSGMAIILFTVGVFVLLSSIKTDRTVKAQVKQLSQQTEDGMTDGVPSEDDPPLNIGSYTVAPDLPKFIKIDKVGVYARILRMGVDSSNVLKAPSNIFDVGWYDGSAKPGEAGTVVMDGHVSGPTKRGVFYNIGSLKQGDKITVERGDGKVFSYSVTGTQIYDADKVDMPKVMTSSVDGKQALNLVTCAGRFNAHTNSYEQRVVVFTVQD